MLIKVELVAEGPGPSEAVVSIRTIDEATEEVVLSRRILHDGLVDVGEPLMARNGAYLVELPRETMSGRWRVWVPGSEAVRSAKLQAAE